MDVWIASAVSLGNTILQKNIYWVRGPCMRKNGTGKRKGNNKRENIRKGTKVGDRTTVRPNSEYPKVVDGEI